MEPKILFSDSLAFDRVYIPCPERKHIGYFIFQPGMKFNYLVIVTYYLS